MDNTDNIDNSIMSRRQFLKVAGIAAGTAGVLSQIEGPAASEEKKPDNGAAQSKAKLEESILETESKLVDLARISLAEFRKNIKRCPAVTMAIGSIEWHGAHLPLGFDTLKADALCRRIASDAGCFAAPPLFYGYAYHFNQQGLMPAMYSNLDAFREYLKSIFDSFYDIGFRVIFTITGHYENLQVLTLKTAAQIVMDERDGLRIFCHKEPDFTAESGHGGDHAGFYETSLGLAMFPELVHMDRGGKANDLNVGIKPKGERKPPNFESWVTYFEDGKSKASAFEGQKLVEMIVHKGADEIRNALADLSKNHGD